MVMVCCMLCFVSVSETCLLPVTLVGLKTLEPRMTLNFCSSWVLRLQVCAPTAGFICYLISETEAVISRNTNNNLYPQWVSLWNWIIGPYCRSGSLSLWMCSFGGVGERCAWNWYTMASSSVWRTTGNWAGVCVSWVCVWRERIMDICHHLFL